MLEKAQEVLFEKIKEGLLDKTSVEVPFKYFIFNWFPNQRVEDQVLTKSLMDFDKKYDLDHIVILDGKGAIAVRFWWQKRWITED
jgi:hypothetical protein